MSHGKAAARDLRWGRQGGRWAEGSSVEVALSDLAKARDKGIVAGTWPTVAAEVCRYCRGPVHDDQRLRDEIAGRVRMAQARQAAGMALDRVDREVLG